MGEQNTAKSCYTCDAAMAVFKCCEVKTFGSFRLMGLLREPAIIVADDKSELGLSAWFDEGQQTRGQVFFLSIDNDVK